MEWAALLAAIRLRPILINALGVLLAVFLRHGVIESSATDEAIFALFVVADIGILSALVSAAAGWVAQLRAGRVDDELKRIQPILDSSLGSSFYATTPLVRRIHATGGSWRVLLDVAAEEVDRAVSGVHQIEPDQMLPLEESPDDPRTRSWDDIQDFARFVNETTRRPGDDPSPELREYLRTWDAAAAQRLSNLVHEIAPQRLVARDHWDGYALRISRGAMAFEVLPAILLAVGVPIAAIVTSPL